MIVAQSRFNSRYTFMFHTGNPRKMDQSSRPTHYIHLPFYRAYWGGSLDDWKAFYPGERYPLILTETLL